MYLLPPLFLLPTIFALAQTADEPTYEKQTRCIAHCVDYNKDALSPGETFSCRSATCMQCIEPCQRLPELPSQCKANCGNGSTECSNSCDYIKSMGEPSTGNANKPRRPGSPKLVGDKLEWKKDDFQFYSDNSSMGAVFLVLGSRVVVNVSGSIDNSFPLNWKVISQTSAELSVNISLIAKKMMPICGQSYIFKVATFSKIGSRGYKTSRTYTASQLLNATCVPWYPVGSHPPPYCQPSPAFSRSQLDLLSVNSADSYSFYYWNDDCSNLLASREVSWRQSHNISNNNGSCYEVYVSVVSNELLTGSDCGMENHVYYVRGDETKVILESLKPKCYLVVAVFAGTLETSRQPLYDSSLQLKIRIPKKGRGLYESIDYLVKPSIYNQDLQQYHVTVMWDNPPALVDNFTIIEHLSGTLSLPNEYKITAVPSWLHIYSYTLNIEPNVVDSKQTCILVELQPEFDGIGYIGFVTNLICSQSLVPGAPVNITTDATSDSVTIMWQRPTHVHAYHPVVKYVLGWLKVSSNVDQLNQNHPWNRSVELSSNMTKYTVMGLSPNSRYFFKVGAFSDASNNGTFADWVEKRTAGQQQPSTDDGGGVPITAIAGSVGGGVVLTILIIIIALIAIKREKRKYHHHLNQLELETFRPPVLPPVLGQVVEEPDEWEIDPGNLNLLDVLGEGFFGIVLKGEVYHYGPPITTTEVRPLGTLHQEKRKKSKAGNLKMEKTVVACKMLKEVGTIADQQEILEEIKLMKKIAQHRHIVSILGCITRSHPVCLIVEYCENGDLLHYLRKNRPAWLLATRKHTSKQVDPIGNPYSAVPGTLRDKEGYVPMAAPHTPEKIAAEAAEIVDIDDEKLLSERLTSYDLLSFAKQIALGMEYLAEKSLVHRDLACRNVLVAEDTLLKISDFGLTRAVHKDATYTQKTRGRLPLKWMALESITDRVFTTYSDIWSFGIVLWEICTLGGFPYPTIPNERIVKKLHENYRMERPENCSEELYTVMLQCWHPVPDLRPPFSALVMAIEEMMDTEKAGLYIDLNFDKQDQYWMSVSELGDSDSDAEPEVPFEETHLQRVLFREGNVHASMMGIAQRALRLSGAFSEEVENDPLLMQASNVPHPSLTEMQLQNGHPSGLQGTDLGMGNGRLSINGGTIPIDHRGEEMTSV